MYFVSSFFMCLVSLFSYLVLFLFLVRYVFIYVWVRHFFLYVCRSLCLCSVSSFVVLFL